MMDPMCNNFMGMMPNGCVLLFVLSSFFILVYNTSVYACFLVKLNSNDI